MHNLDITMDRISKVEGSLGLEVRVRIIKLRAFILKLPNINGFTLRR